jgi:hypothetical protein
MVSYFRSTPEASLAPMARPKEVMLTAKYARPALLSGWFPSVLFD